MKKPVIAVTLVTIYLLAYTTAMYLQVDENILFALFCFSPFLVAGMVYVVLKYGVPSMYTFDERFYDDLDYIRNGKEEI
ncbi:MAG: hypothetical protein ABIY51_03025 [Ferruginibacter sp.]